MTRDMLSYEPLAFGIQGDEKLVEWQEHFRLDDQRIAHGLGTRLQARQSDLLDLAVAVYVTDRLRPRRPMRARDDGRWWSRRLPLRLAVRDPDFWNSTPTLSLVHQLLEWLTDDEWKLEFHSTPRHRRWAETQEPLFSSRPEAPAHAGLLSGGLDSLLGAEIDLRQVGGELLLIAAGTHSRLVHLQQAIAAGLSQVGPRRARLFVVPVGLTAAAKQLSADPEETSQRVRGFVFLSFGAVVADAAGLNQLRVYENGVGALNLPLTAAQRGAMNTRAMRPETLAMMSRLVSLMLDRPFEIVNPSFWKTKAEMCAQARPEIGPLMAQSVSCDTGLTHRASALRLCGVCTSCLLRRQALLSAGLKAIDRSDLEQMRGDGLRAPSAGQASEGLLCMLNQAMTIAMAVDAPHPWSALVEEYPELAGIRHSLDCEPSRLVDLLTRYVRDWRNIHSQTVQAFLGTPSVTSPVSVFP